MIVFSNIVFPLTAGVAATSSLLAFKKYGVQRKTEFSKVWLGLFLGIFLWALGDLTWAVYVLYLKMEPFPSFADVFYLGGYFLLFLALYLLFKMFKSAFSREMFRIAVSVTWVLTLVVSCLVFIPIVASSEDMLTMTLASAYPILDLTLFALSFSVFLIFLKGEVGKAWFFFSLGIILTSVADLFLSYAELQGFYFEGNPFELFWLWGYVAFLLGFQIHTTKL